MTTTPSPTTAHQDQHEENARVSAMLDATRILNQQLAGLCFSEPVAHVYNPLTYAWAPYEQYLRRYARQRKRVVLLGMNPGPFGMMQTGVPFGEIAAVRDWLGLDAPIETPTQQHPKRPIQGYACTRSEVSGRRLWGWAAQRHPKAEDFFREWLVLNWCPLVWLQASGANLTPDKLRAHELQPVTQACDAYIAQILSLLQPEFLIGVGGFAEKRLRLIEARCVESGQMTAGRQHLASILHPSPASPAANRGWHEAVEAKLKTLGL